MPGMAEAVVVAAVVVGGKAVAPGLAGTVFYLKAQKKLSLRDFDLM